MTYRILPEQLHTTADLVRRYMEGDLGLSKPKIEEEIDPHIEYVPTLSARTPDHHIFCAEVSEVIISTPILNFILQCQQKHFPALLYTAIASAAEYSGFRKDLRTAKEYGVGVLEVNHETGGVTSLNDPLSLSLTGLRPLETKNFPKKYRVPLSDASKTFRNGNPNKGCSMVYDEIEQLTRRIACKTYKENFWNTTVKNPKRMEEKMAWATVLKELRDKLDRSKASQNGKNLYGLSEVLLNRVIGITSHRNQSGHKPSSMVQLKNRDGKLRTRMEDGIDLLAELIENTKSLRV